MGSHEHDWVYDPDKLLSNPPRQHCICALCLTTEFTSWEPRGDARRFYQLLEQRMDERREAPLTYVDILHQLLDCGFSPSAATVIAGFLVYFQEHNAHRYLRTLRGTEIPGVGC